MRHNIELHDEAYRARENSIYLATESVKELVYRNKTFGSEYPISGSTLDTQELLGETYATT